MKKNQIMGFILSTILCVCTLCGCTQQTEAEPESEPTAGMPNPMVEVSSDDAFLNELGFSIDSTFLSEDPERFIISGEMAHVAFYVNDPEGKPVKCIFRGTRNDEWNANPIELIAGDYSPDFDEPSEVILNTTDGEISFKTVHSDSSATTISYWDYKDVHYTLSIGGNISQMSIAALNDSALLAISAHVVEDESAETVKYVVPLIETVDPDNIEDAIFNSKIENIRQEDGIIMADITLYTMDLYDAVDITSLSEGDNIMVQGENIVVESITDGNSVDLNDGEGERGVKVINGGIEEGGAEFISNGGGTFRYFGFNDHASYTEQCSVSLAISDDVLITDTSDLENPDGLTLTSEDLLGLKDKEFDPGFSVLNSKVRIVDNVVVEINRWFIP